MSNQILVDALAPIVSRVVTSHCWKKHDGKLSHIKQALTPAKLAHHVNGGPAYGAAQIQPGSSETRVAIFDLDSHKGETPWHEMQAVALEIMTALESRDLRPIPFRSSGGHGIHIYLLWDAPQDAYSVRQALRSVLEACGLSEGTKGVSAREVELSPKQNSVPVDGFGNMVVLPLAGKSVPLDGFELEDLEKEYAAGMEWPVSSAIPLLEREQPVAPAVGEVSVELETLKSALDAIPNSGDDELDYDAWRNVIFALHHATQGSSEGLALAHEFSARSSKYVPAFLEERVWPFAGKSDDANRAPITARSILFLARDAYGWQEDVSGDFDVVPVERAADGKPLPEMPTLRRDSKGSILPTVENVQKSLASPAMVDWLIGYDAFRDELMWTPRGAVEWRSFTDPDYFRLRITLEQRGFKPVSKDIMRDAVAHAGDENKFDSAVTWLNGLPAHDGVARVETFLTRYFGVDDTPYTRAVSLYLWSAMAGRVLQPGVKADMVPILVGPQGIGKSSGIAAMVPSIEHFVEVSLGEKDDNLARTMRGKLVGEIAELRGLQTRDLETVKAFVTRTHEQWVPKFKEFAQLFPRRLVFIGTTNQNEFLADETGNRRWLPVNATFADRDAITADQLQLWAEARLKFIANGVMWSEAQALAGDAHAEHTVTDTWAESVEHWLNEPEFEGEIQRRATPIRTHDVLVGALNFVARDIQRVHENRVGRLMVALGFEKRVRRVDGRNTKVWVEIAENDLW
jgi:hypothetical protein